VNAQVEKLMKENGAALVGFADLRDIAPEGYPRGVSVAIGVPPDIVRMLQQGGPNARYLAEYRAMNEKLDELITLGAAFFRRQGYRALARRVAEVPQWDYRTPLPHKTVATRAALGWIGKSALLVTPQYGPAVRISTILTDAPLQCAEPITTSRCGKCSVCVDNCPGKAISGTLWEAGMDRDALFELDKCMGACHEMTRSSDIGQGMTLCGRCFAVCPYTKRYLRKIRH
jgi:epoxyqueuosine reductase